METILIKALQLVLSLSILVIVHEFGHFIFARVFKVRVDKFYLFFDPWFALFRYKPRKGDTEYGVGWVPLGGYVKISGMIDESMDKEFLKNPPQPWEFRTKPAWQRLLIMVGGVLMNFALAFFIYSLIAFKWGDNYIPMDKTPLYFGDVAQEVGFRDGDILLKADGKRLTRYDELDLFRTIEAEEVTLLRGGEELTVVLPEDFEMRVITSRSPFADFRSGVVDSVIAGGFADEAGLRRGDRIVSVDGRRTWSFAALTSSLSEVAGTDVLLAVLRDGEEIELAAHVDSEGKLGFTVLSPAVGVSDGHNVLTAVPAGLRLGYRKLSFYVLQLRLVFTREGIRNIGGLGAIGNLFPSKWSWPAFWDMTALLSIMLGVMNLLPVPALDGGHVLFTVYEIITRRKPSERFLERAQYAGMFLLILLMLYANGNDILRLFTK
ncbi:MAG: RIP metalloprotease RseP [Dysgonamonadaceae bacterium]|jgi:regulator of sigma E protease|nr:RIP metalloprotease RseP [Dysgonamonadaceae bacterium]